MTEEIKPIKKRNRHSIQDYLDVINECDGLEDDCAKALGITKHGFLKRVSENETLQQAMMDAQKIIYNLAKKKLKEKINEGHWQSIEFVLKNTIWGREEFNSDMNINVNVARVDTTQYSNEQLEGYRELAKEKAKELAANIVDA